MIGIGHVYDAQIKALSLINDMNVVAAYDIDTTKKIKLQEGIIFYEKLEDIIGNNSIDIYIVMTPNNTHFSIAKQILNHKKNLLLEKPATATHEELMNLYALSKKHNTYFDIAMHAYFANDLLWYKNNIDKLGINFGPITSFYSKFYDHYCKDNQVIVKARGLEGSWHDSGINALSVICSLISPSLLEVTDSRFVELSSNGCKEIQGTIDFSIKVDNAVGRGVIDTNWCIHRDKKITELFYDITSHKIVLNHSEETITIYDSNNMIYRKNFSNDNIRLVNHYTNLYKDQASRFINKQPNILFAMKCHKLFFDSIDFNN